MVGVATKKIPKSTENESFAIPAVVVKEYIEELFSQVPIVFSPEPQSYPAYIQRNDTQAIR